MDKHIINLLVISSFALLCACQQANNTAPTPVVQATGIPTPEGMTVTPYEHPEIKRQSIPVPKTNN